MWRVFAEEAAAGAADAAGAAGATSADAMTAGGGIVGMIITLAPMVLLIVVFYFILIRPQRKREKETHAMLEALKVGDKIITIGGIVGTVTKIKDDMIVIETGTPTDKRPMMMERNSVKTVEKKISDD